MKNILDNADYEELEFVVLDYNSQDGMEFWAQENLGEYIASGKVVYYKTFEPSSFSHSHAKNLALKLGSGDILCSINADHFTGPGFATYVNDAFHKNNSTVLTHIPVNPYQKTKTDSPTDLWGKVCVKKNHFLAVKGMDERMATYGWEDVDFINRLELINIRKQIIDNPAYAGYLTHNQEQRYSSKKLTDSFHSIYINYCTPSVSQLIYLYKDFRFEKGTLLDNSTINSQRFTYAYKERQYRYEFIRKEAKWLKGTWKEDEQEGAVHFFSRNKAFSLKKSITRSDMLTNENKNETFYSVSSENIYKILAEFNFQYRNNEILEQNIRKKTIQGNTGDFGKGIVFRNFNYNLPIQV